MKLGRYITGIILLSLFILFAIANNDIVRINFPRILDLGIEKSIYLPIYLLVSSAVFVGVIIGALMEYLRNVRFRKAYNKKNKQALSQKLVIHKGPKLYISESYLSLIHI